MNLRPHGPQPCALPNYAILRYLYYNPSNKKIQVSNLFIQDNPFVWGIIAGIIFFPAVFQLVAKKENKLAELLNNVKKSLNIKISMFRLFT